MSENGFVVSNILHVDLDALYYSSVCRWRVWEIAKRNDYCTTQEVWFPERARSRRPETLTQCRISPHWELVTDLILDIRLVTEVIYTTRLW